jgi:catalase
MSGSPASATVVTQLVETMRTLAGPHPGFRPVHAKRIVCSGTFRASAGARAGEPGAAFTRASGPNRSAFLQFERVPTYTMVSPTPARWR